MKAGALAHLLIVLALFAPASAGQAPAAIQAAPARALFDEWLAAFNSGVPPTILAFDAARQVTPPDINQTMFLRATTGGFTLIRMERSDAHALAALVQENFSEQLHRVELTVDPATSRIALLTVRAVTRPADLAIPRLSEAAAVAALADRADRAAAAGEFSGVLLVARGDNVLLQRAWGLADREAAGPVTLDTRFEIASVAKMFEAVAALQLVEAGKLRLDDVVGMHFPSYANPEVASKVTIRHLLMHTGGMGGLPPPDVRRNLKTPADYVRVLESRAPASPPGAEYQYSNYGYILLAAIVERASGMALQDYLQQHVFGPAGMSATSVGAPLRPQEGRARGYRKQEGRWVLASAGDIYMSGEPFSTAADLLRFSQALDSGRLISKQLLEQARTPPPGGRYGYGLLITDHGPFVSYGHSGSGAGVNADVRIVPAGGYVIVGLSNFEQPAAGRMVDFFLNRLPAP